MLRVLAAFLVRAEELYALADLDRARPIHGDTPRVRMTGAASGHLLRREAAPEGVAQDGRQSVQHCQSLS
jgi:hypothetical protein